MAKFAESLSHDPDLAQVLAEAFDLLGPDGRLEIRAGRSRKLVLELFDGLYWDSGLFTRELARGGAGKITLTEPAILITDLEIKEPDELVPLLDLACGAGTRELVLLAGAMSEKALAILRLPANRRLLQVAAVKAPAGNVPRADTLADMALLMGGRPLLAAAGDTLAGVRPEHLGRARRAWADSEYFGIEAGQGDPRRLRQHIARLRTALARAEDPDDRQRQQQRLSRLINGSAVLWVGANTPLALEARQEVARRTAEAVRGALREGVVPGGGVALLNLKPALQAKVCAARGDEERLAYKILGTAVEAPLRALLANSGCEPETILAEIGRLPAGYGCDVTRGEIKDLAKAGIVDAAPVVKSALYHAIQSAALALTIEILIQRANPPMGIKQH
jgi:chaperonin GroEL